MKPLEIGQGEPLSLLMPRKEIVSHLSLYLFRKRILGFWTSTASSFLKNRDLFQLMKEPPSVGHEEVAEI